MHDTGCLGLVHWDNPEGGYGEGGGRRVQDKILEAGIPSYTPVSGTVVCAKKVLNKC